MDTEPDVLVMKIFLIQNEQNKKNMKNYMNEYELD